MLFDPYAYDLARSARQGARSSGAALAEAALLEVPPEARALLWQGLREAVSGAVDLWERLPGHPSALPPCSVQHAGKPQYQARMLRAQTLSGWHRMMGIELRLAVEALERLAVAADAAREWARLAEQCGRVGQLYAELKRRAGAVVALSVVRWELRLLRYRASPALVPLLYD
jgi:hypothetical protein